MKKTGLLILVVVLVLGAIGVGYAAWSQTLTINGTVTAAKFDVNFTNATVPTAPTEGTVSDVISAPGPAIGKTATITVTNAYPGWKGDFVLTVTNAATIPVTLALSGPTGDTLSLFSASVDPSGSIDAGHTYDYTITVTIPNDWIGNANSEATETVQYTILASQSTP